MINKNIIRMTSLLAVFALTGCSIPGTSFQNNAPVNNGTTQAEQPAEVVKPANFSGGQKAPAEGMIPGEKEMNALSNASFNILYNTVKADENSNVLLSPASLAFALAMTENGAQNETLAQMEEYVNGGIPIDDMNPLLNYISYKLNNSEEVSWGVANSLWLNDLGGSEFDDEFLRKSIEYYDAEVYKKQFDQSVIDEINDWVYNKTDKMIDGVLDDLSPEAILFLINAIAFDGEWETEYENESIAENMKFTNADGSESFCTKLYSLEDRYFELGEGIGFIKPYKGGEYSFVGILPNEGVSTEEYIKGIAEGNEDFSEAVRNPEYYDVHVYIPEFTNDYSNEMSEIYKGMGMDIPFDEDKADLHRMFKNDKESSIWIDKVIHKTHIEVDRKGTRAAAVTVVEVDKCTAVAPVEDPIIIDLNRPFVYAIVDNETGLPIFLGCQNSLE